MLDEMVNIEIIIDKDKNKVICKWVETDNPLLFLKLATS